VARLIRLGVAGLGRMGSIHADNVAAHVGGAELAGVVDAVEPVARKVGTRLSAPWSTDLADLLADPEIDAIVVAGPTATHAAIVEQAAAAAKHVLCEKPLSLDHRQSVRAIQAARAAGIKLQIGLQRRFDPDWAAAFERISRGELGDVHLFRASLRDPTAPPEQYLRTSGGLFVDASIHMLDVARWLIDEVTEVTAFGSARTERLLAEIGDVDTAVACLRFRNGALGVIDTSRVAAYGAESSAEVMGSRATLRLAHDRRTNLQWRTPGRVSYELVGDFAEQYARAYVLELQAFVAAIRDDAEPAVTGEDALAAYVLAQACTRSLHERQPVRLTPRDGAFGIDYAIDGDPVG
jgi:myo-inositol 2-dehydrogenase / D-chiro-inositol 1-dehydrogenase